MTEKPHHSSNGERIALRIANSNDSRIWFERLRRQFDRSPTLTRRLPDGGLAFIFQRPRHWGTGEFGIDGVEIDIDDGRGRVLIDVAPVEFPPWLDAEHTLRAHAAGAQRSAAEGWWVRQWVRPIGMLAARSKPYARYAASVLIEAIRRGGMYRHEAAIIVAEEFAVARSLAAEATGGARA